MTTEPARRRPRRATGGVAQLPWRTVVNPYRPVEILTADDVETLHTSSLRILSEIGIEVLGDRALDLLARAGARVDRPLRNVRLDPAHVEELVALAPSSFRLHARNPLRDVLIGDGHVVFSSVGGPAFVTDLDRGRRPGNHADFLDYVKVIGALDIIHQEGGGPLEPQRPARSRPGRGARRPRPLVVPAARPQSAARRRHRRRPRRLQLGRRTGVRDGS